MSIVDADRDGKPSIGDYEIPRQVFLNAAGRKLGEGTGVCVQINRPGTLFQCQWQHHFADGDIVTAGRFWASSKTSTLAVVGGTGVYDGMAGTVKSTRLDAKTLRARLVFSLHK
jgi:hypothetical protein